MTTQTAKTLVDERERVSLGTGYKLWLAVRTWLKN